MLNTLTLCPQQPEDKAFVFELFAELRRSIFIGLPEAMAETLVRQQFEIQCANYTNTYPDAAFNIVKTGQVNIGRLVIDRSGGAIRVIDIALLAAYRNRGIGTFLIRTLQEEAKLTSACVYLSVERQNPALRWYLRLGFEVLQDNEVYLQLKWLP